MTRVNMDVDMDTELVKESSKKAEEQMAQESSSKRAGEELEQKVAKKQKMEDDEEKEDLKQCFEIVQDDEVAIDAIPLATKLAHIGDLKTMFEHHVEDLIWKNLQGKKVLLLRLYDSYGIHFVRFEDMHVYMLVEKRYPFTPATITDMLNKKLQADYWNEMFILLGTKVTTDGVKVPTCLMITTDGRVYAIRQRIDQRLSEKDKDCLCDKSILLGSTIFMSWCSLLSTNDGEDLGKLKPKADIGIFIVIMEYLVKVNNKARILELKRRNIKKTDSDIQYAVSIKEDTVYLCLHFTKDHEGNKINTPYPENPIRRRITSITVNGKNAYELKGKFLDDLHNNAFSGTNEEDAVEHIEYFLRIIDPIDLPNVNQDKLRVVFPISLAGDAWRCWREDGYCNGGNLPRAYIVGNTLHYQDLEWYDALKDNKLKKEALKNRVIMEGMIDDNDKSSNNG
ncbi:hypothetical protein Tco_0937838 [Tanacetum coccineum]|uniref:Uncharacterized protein n=1 Tax=Tanacetum coccineum TaxID=301880 RepID=A0ABQ5DGD2_9ASTR